MAPQVFQPFWDDEWSWNSPGLDAKPRGHCRGSHSPSPSPSRGPRAQGWAGEAQTPWFSCASGATASPGTRRKGTARPSLVPDTSPVCLVWQGAGGGTLSMRVTSSRAGRAPQRHKLGKERVTWPHPFFCPAGETSLFLYQLQIDTKQFCNTFLINNSILGEQWFIHMTKTWVDLFHILCTPALWHLLNSTPCFLQNLQEVRYIQLLLC